MRFIFKAAQIVTIILLLALATTGGALRAGPAALPMQVKVTHALPELAQMAAQQPEQRVAVIVQKVGKGSAAEEMVARLGGAVTRDLTIINAFTAQMPAAGALELARQPDVRWVSLDTPTAYSGGPIDTKKLVSAYIQTIGADRVWNEGPAYLQGQGIAVAVVDSGDCRNGSTDRTCNDLRVTPSSTRIVATTSFVGGQSAGEMSDGYGHGSLVEGVIGGNGNGSGGDGLSMGGRHMGIAPNVNLVNVKVADNEGLVLASDVVSGLQWVLNNKATYNIRVVNLSLNSTVAESYQTNPIAAACEILWFNGIVVVVSAGNNGTAALYPPANDPFVITVGATDDRGTTSLNDDVMASFSAYGTDESGATKPDLVAPGTNLISVVPINESRIWKEHKSHYIKEYASQEYYMRVSGTSFAAPVVSGAVALLLQDEPDLNPDQVKYRLMSTANKNWPGYNAASSGAGYLDIYAAVHGASNASANTGIPVSSLLTTGTAPFDNSLSLNSLSWNSLSWNSLSWNSVSWNSLSWNSLSWNSDYWGK